MLLLCARFELIALGLSLNNKYDLIYRVVAEVLPPVVDNGANGLKL